MAIEPVFEKINVTAQGTPIKGQIKIDCKTDVETSTVEKVLSVNAFAVISQSETLKAELSYGGKVTFYVSYLGVDGEVYKCECGSEFSGVLASENLVVGMRVKSNATVEKTEVSSDGLRLETTAFISITAIPCERKEINALSGGEDLIVDTSDVSIVKSFGMKEGVFPLEEEFELNYPVKEVLSHRADVVVTSVQCGVGAIIVDGEVFLTLIALQKNEKKDIIRENKVLPFRYELECEDAMPTMQATARAKERSFKTDISVDTEKGTSTLLSSVTLQIEGEAFANTSTSLVVDAFSTKEQVELIYDEVPYNKACEQYGTSFVYSGRSAVEELPVGAVLLAVGGEKTDIISTVKNDSGIDVTGTVTAIAYLRDGDGKVFTRTLETPFERTIDCTCGENHSVETACVPTKAMAKIVSLTEMELNCEILFTVYPCENNSIKYVKEIKCVGEKTDCSSAISVFIASEGEDLWSLSKRLNVCPETLVLTNKDLQFPLTGKERIVIYRQK